MTEIKELLKEFERFAYGQSLHTAFTDILDWIVQARLFEDSRANLFQSA